LEIGHYIFGRKSTNGNSYLGSQSLGHPYFITILVDTTLRKGYATNLDVLGKVSGGFLG